MSVLTLKFRVDVNLSQQFKSAVSTSYLHAALMHISYKAKDFTKQSNYGPVNVYAVVFDTSKNPRAPSQMLQSIGQIFPVTQIDQYHFYVG